VIKTGQRKRTAALPVRTFAAVPGAKEKPLPFQTLQPERRRGKIVIVIILLVWLIMTMRLGPDWLTPTELAFFALLVNSSVPSNKAIAD
jgi:hypothetical protein